MDRSKLPIPKVMNSIVCQLAGQNTEEMLVVCYYPDATPEDLPVTPPRKGTEFVFKISCGTTLIFANPLISHHPGIMLFWK